MITTIYLVRHAHSTYTPDELNRPLSSKGKETAERVTELLIDKEIDYIISSPYKRAIQTIEGLSEKINKNIMIEDDFRERLLAGEPVENFEEAINKVWEDYSFCLEGGESNIVAQERGVKALEGIMKKYEGANITIGTHGNIMTLIMNYYDSRYDFKFWKNLGMPDIYRLRFENGRLIETEKLFF